MPQRKELDGRYGFRGFYKVFASGVGLGSFSEGKERFQNILTSFDGPLLGFKKVKNQRERLKTKARKGKDEKEDKTLKGENPHAKCVCVCVCVCVCFFFWTSFYYKIGEMEILTFFWPTD